ncbi:hypothetical protein FRC06_011465 [Ceratobasidium sp. 370]|nr:hypothetical protein FRC06_011465 [Ceratobasidium sp. 370]
MSHSPMHVDTPGASGSGSSSPLSPVPSSSAGSPHRSQTPTSLREEDPLHRCTPVHGMGGIVSSPELRSLQLGVVTDWNAVCRLTCSQYDRMIPSTPKLLRLHAKKHWIDGKFPSKYTVKFFSGLMTRLVLRRGGREARAEPGSPIRVKLCDKLATREKHHLCHKKEHKVELKLDACERPVFAQTFCPSSMRDKTWFEVTPELEAIAERQDALDEDTLGATTPKPVDLAAAYIKQWRPAGELPVDVEVLQDVQLFLFFTRWAFHVQDRDLDRLQALVRPPESKQRYRNLYNTGTQYLRNKQERIKHCSQIIQFRLMDDEAGPAKSPFNLLAASTAKDYGRLFGLWCVFVARLQDMMQSDDRWHPITMT